VLLISNRRDVSLDWIVRELRSRNSTFFRLNTEVADQLAWSARPGEAWVVASRDVEISFDDLESVLYRRPEPPALRGMSRSEALVVRNQWRALIGGLEALPGVRWMSLPSAIDRAEGKLIQLQAARDVGLIHPDTIVTNSRLEAIAFVRSMGGSAICKALDAPLFAQRGSSSFVFATVVDEMRLGSMMDLEAAPIVLQRSILPKLDVRVTVAGPRVIAAACHASTVDWRLDPAAQFRPFRLPLTISRRCADLVHLLGLRFAGIDFARDAQGTFWFLEANPNGEWGWLQAAGLPIAEAISADLVGEELAR
jgi:glutathione synthase/RimK-type ligase-like ATP-grasp enzyme